MVLEILEHLNRVAQSLFERKMARLRRRQAAFDDRAAAEVAQRFRPSRKRLKPRKRGLGSDIRVARGS